MPRTSAAAAPRLAVAVLGTMRIAIGERELRLRNRKARAVLACLLLGDSGEESRERLVGLLWSDSEEEKARASLRQAVHELREALNQAGWPHLRAERSSIALDPQGVELDLREVLREAEAGRVHRRLLDAPRLAETLLEGFDDIDPAFRVWLLARRQSFHDRLMRGLEPALRREGATPRQRRELAEAVLRLDPSHEEACRVLMRAAAEEGDTAAALRAYEQLWEVLGEEYDMEPSAPTQALVADIKSGRIEAAPQRAPEPPRPAAARAPSSSTAEAAAPPRAGPEIEPPPAGLNRVALLVEPFSVNGVPEDRAHLVFGFRVNLIDALVRFREWFVVDGHALPPREETASRVSGRYRIGATAYQAGERISMVLTLREDDTAIYLWSQRVDLQLDGWFETQQNVVRRIAMALNAQLSAQRLAHLTGEDDDPSLEAYDRWLRGTAMIRRFSPENWERAARLFGEIIERSPQFSPAYSSLAQMENSVHIIHPGVRRDREREERSLRLARRAVQLDPTDSRAQLTLGWSFAMANRHGQAEMHMDLACELNANDSWTLISAALFRAFCGHHDKAAALARQSLEMTLAPSLTHWGYLVSIAYLRGDDLAALDALDRAEDVIRTLPGWRAAALANLGRMAEARAEAGRFLAGIREAWFGEEPASDAAITRWLLHLYPISTAENWARLRDGLARAGLPVEGVAHRDW